MLVSMLRCPCDLPACRDDSNQRVHLVKAGGEVGCLVDRERVRWATRCALFGVALIRPRSGLHAYLSTIRW